MDEQNYQNHRKIDPMFHRGLSLLTLVTLILSVIYIVQNIESQILLSLVILTMVLTIILMAMMLRFYVLKLQDRIIRNEENFRCYRLTKRDFTQNAGNDIKNIHLYHCPNNCAPTP
ncbi:DUF6526 family protein [Pseudalkalibacillus decolorationis]|uniref:DUF6526 family protein n=1 Tax=Pseudalkalibacillus decolorationis TaxID=163879 RepID=UPI0027E2C34F|nr:DUF6526 family protein [Pseudalkalibacillus decolorationis]